MSGSEPVTSCRTCGSVVGAGAERCPVCDAPVKAVPPITQAPLRVLPVGPPSRTPEVPVTLSERFVVEGELGAGGMGVVQLARDSRLDRQVAIKLIREPSPELVARFEIEARLMASLEHDNLVRIYEYGISAGVPFLVMEYVRGPTLSRRLSTGRPTLVEAVRITVDILKGIGAAHERGIIHRDLKPGNVFLDTSGRAKVADFGLALRVADPASGRAERERLTGEGEVMGTPGYMAPETIGGEDATPAASRVHLFSPDPEGSPEPTRLQPRSPEHRGRRPAPRSVAPTIEYWPVEQFGCQRGSRLWATGWLVTLTWARPSPLEPIRALPVRDS